MLVRGRRLDPRRIVRYLFQELIAPWIQFKRVGLRVTWFFTTPIYIGPMWTTSVVAGLCGVMLTIMLFKPPGRLEASTRPIAVTTPQNFLAPPFVPPPTEPVPQIPWDIGLDDWLHRTTLGYDWDQLRQTTLVSTASSAMSPQSFLQPIRDGWSTAQRHMTQSWPAIYRQTAKLWDAAAMAAAVQPSDRPASYGGASESHPSLLVTRDLPEEAPPSEPITYAIIVQNRGAELLEQILVSEELANLDRVESTHPPADVSATALHWRIDALRPGQERRLAVTLQPGPDREVRAIGEVRASVAVSSSTRVAPAQSPLTINETPPALLETPPALLETPRLAAPVEPASREVIPRIPRLSVIAEIPTTLKVDDELSTVFVVSNTGNGDADGVVLTVEVPAGLEHRDGVLVEHRYAHIPAGSAKRAVFKALARTPSSARIDAVLTIGGVRVADWTTQVQIAAKPIVTPAPLPGSTTIPGSSGPVPDDGPAIGRPGFRSSPSLLNGSTPINPAPSGSTIPRDRSIPANAIPPRPSLPVDSSIPRNRRPPVSIPQGSAPSSVPPAGGVPGSVMPELQGPSDTSIPKSGAPAPGENPEAPEDGTFVNVPRRQGAGGVSAWKRVMHR